MTEPQYPSQPPPPYGQAPYGPGPTRRRSVAALVIGWILIVLGFFTTLAGVILFAIFGNGSSLSTKPQTLSSSAPALVADLGTIQNVSGWGVWTAQPTMLITLGEGGGKPTFIGIAPTADIDRYLSGIARDQITDFDLDPFRLSVQPRPGADKAGKPADQTFWVAKVESGSAPQLSWPVADGSYSVVVMNADGSAGVNAPTSVGVSIPKAQGLWITVIVIGAVLLIGGIVLVVVGAKRVPVQYYSQPLPRG